MPSTVQHRPWAHILPGLILATFALTAGGMISADHDKREACSWATSSHMSERCSAAYDDGGRLDVAALQSEAR